MIKCIKIPKLSLEVWYILIEFRHNPYAVFKKSDTPFGLYARQKWIGLEGDTSWQRDFDNRVAQLMEGQLYDGSWKESLIETAHRLFGLHLTLRHPTELINKALDWLFENTVHNERTKNDHINELNLRDIPFVTGDLDLLYLAITLFMCTIFNRADDHKINTQYQALSGYVFAKNKDLKSSDINNALRALVVHPIYATDPATLFLVERLFEVQHDSGEWPNGTPFYQTVNALAHLSNERADLQLKKAFRRLADTQNPDGTWGNDEKEWNTFLVVHALRNKKII